MFPEEGTVSGNLLPVTIVTWVGLVLIAVIAAVVTAYVAHEALAKARPADVPRVLAALARIAEVVRRGGDR